MSDALAGGLMTILAASRMEPADLRDGGLALHLVLAVELVRYGFSPEMAMGIALGVQLSCVEPEWARGLLVDVDDATWQIVRDCAAHLVERLPVGSQAPMPSTPDATDGGVA